MGGGGGSSSIKAPPLVTTNVGNAQSVARNADIQAYNLSDADYAKRFPDLVAGRSYNVNNAVSNLEGQTDPHITQALQSAGLGSPDLGNTEFEQARSLGQPILKKEQRDRNYFQTLLSDNPQRAFGLSGGDVANIALSNVGAANSYNQGIYGTRLAGYNQNLLQNAQNNSALISALGSLAGAGIKYGSQPSYGSSTLNYGYYAGQQPYIPLSGEGR